jgi:hypothetical protein
VSTSRLHDGLGRLTRETNPLGVFEYSYVGTSRRLQTVSYPNGQDVAYAYYPAADDRQLQELHNRGIGGVTLSRFAYAHDDNGAISAWTQEVGGSSATRFDLGYDFANQLAAAALRTTIPHRRS